MAHEVQSREVLHSSSDEQDQTRQRPYFIYGRQLDPATDYLPKPKHKQSGNHGSTTSHLPNTAKYLGVYINSKFSWNHHIDTSTLWFLNRNTAHCFRDVKECCYHTYVRPQLHCGSKKTRQLWRTITTTQFSRF